MTTLFEDKLNQLYDEVKNNRLGNVADYIPELANVDEDNFAISISTVDGHIYQVGESRAQFTIQSISKAFCYGIALEDKGLDYVLSKVDVEPSGEAFNSISLEAETGRPKNPMINAGAIAITSLIKGDSSNDKIDRIIEKFSDYVGHRLEIDKDIYQSEKNTGHRNRAIAHLLRNYGILEEEPEKPLDAYFQQCSINVNCRDLAVMASCLANNGVNPITGVRALKENFVPNVLAVMSTCGMYDYSGSWTYNVGMPAKSGVGGGIIAVLPGQFGLAIYSPRLDAKGNSVRGIEVCEQVSKKFGLHMLNTSKITSCAVIRNVYTGAEIHSKQQHPPHVLEFFADHGNQILVFELMGDLKFVSTELVLREVDQRSDHSNYIILDFYRVTLVDVSAFNFFADLVTRLDAQGKKVIFVGIHLMYYFLKYLKKVLPEHLFSRIKLIKNLDHSLEWCENDLLLNNNASSSNENIVPFNQHSLCYSMTKEETIFLEGLTLDRKFKKGEIICKEGDESKQMFFLISGKVRVSLEVGPNKYLRLGGFSPGNVFGESALLNDSLRSADVVANSDVVVKELFAKDIVNSTNSLANSVQNKLYKNLFSQSDRKLRQANLHIRTLNSGFNPF